MLVSPFPPIRGPLQQSHAGAVEPQTGKRAADVFVQQWVTVLSAAMEFHSCTPAYLFISAAGTSGSTRATFCNPSRPRRSGSLLDGVFIWDFLSLVSNPQSYLTGTQVKCFGETLCAICCFFCTGIWGAFIRTLRYMFSVSDTQYPDLKNLQNPGPLWSRLLILVRFCHEAILVITTRAVNSFLKNYSVIFSPLFKLIREL